MDDNWDICLGNSLRRPVTCESPNTQKHRTELSVNIEVMLVVGNETRSKSGTMT